MTKDKPTPYDVACRLASLYNQSFGGKSGGRYRISPKNLRRLTQCRRISDDYVQRLTEEMFEMEYVFVDMESFYAVTSARMFTNYRRVADILVE